MATVNGNALLGGVGIEVPQGSHVEIIERVDDGLASFRVTWRTPNGPITGTITTNLLDFTAAEIAEHDLPTDANGLPLYRNLRVKYTGQSNVAVTNGDFLFVQDLWYNDDAMECRCVHHGNSRPNTDGRVVIRRDLLERA
ncbi:MAG: hypothetical protein BroJett040_10100 [Oligoflexia bacterium]|nr:MAG: hypothetical protein BroJett040_10100 [Oligoflexia bacterium]